jgi:peroxiredoxin family protein
MNDSKEMGGRIISIKMTMEIMSIMKEDLQWNRNYW